MARIIFCFAVGRRKMNKSQRELYKKVYIALPKVLHQVEFQKL